MIGTNALTGWQTLEFHPSSGRPSDENLIQAIAKGSQSAMRTAPYSRFSFHRPSRIRRWPRGRSGQRGLP
jgi:hypothetical protein